VQANNSLIVYNQKFSNSIVFPTFSSRSLIPTAQIQVEFNIKFRRIYRDIHIKLKISEDDGCPKCLE